MSGAKSWWETVGGVMTGIAALITAVAGLIAVLHRNGDADRETPALPGRAVVSTPEPAVAPAKPKSSARRVASTQNAQTEIPSTKNAPTQNAPAESAPTQRSASREVTPVATPVSAPAETAPRVAVRPSFTVALQPPLEFVLGVPGVSGRFMLVSVRRAPNTPESDVLKVKVRVTGRGRGTEATIVRAGMFEVIPEDGPSIRAEKEPIDNVYVDKTSDEDMVFVIPAQLTHATFRMQYFGDKANIPLDLTPPAQGQ